MEAQDAGAPGLHESLHAYGAIHRSRYDQYACGTRSGKIRRERQRMTGFPGQNIFKSTKRTGRRIGGVVRTNASPLWLSGALDQAG